MTDFNVIIIHARLLQKGCSSTCPLNVSISQFLSSVFFLLAFQLSGRDGYERKGGCSLKRLIQYHNKVVWGMKTYYLYITNMEKNMFNKWGWVGTHCFKKDCEAPFHEISSAIPISTASCTLALLKSSAILNCSLEHQTLQLSVYWTSSAGWINVSDSTRH